ncbi:acyl carrier protein [Lysobacter niabensis]|jgi:acyl carrier protein|uniref:Acyl carrier protein n=1 Tax=Agrilutibacter niabensis TaxID=380628 RepID=A0ABU1VNF0_9GAMM|nr:acyl carrier protein [Lysobacter niabensis]MDR7098870.1 acyl carrier protein [Lysobacter niabensis]
MERRGQIKQFVLQNFLFSDNESAIGDEDPLIRGGVVDSIGIHELIVFLERNFQISVSPEEMTPAIFDSIRSVDEFVTRKLAI